MENEYTKCSYFKLTKINIKLNFILFIFNLIFYAMNIHFRYILCLP